MKVTGFNHLSIGTKNLAESVKFYETVLGMQTIPSYNFGFKTKYLRCGDLQLHIFELEDKIPFYQHFAVDVDDFHAAYDAAKAMGALDSTAFRNPVNELPDGCVQMYLRDPSGNLVEIDWPDVETLDRSRIPEMKLLTEFATLGRRDQEEERPQQVPAPKLTDREMEVLKLVARGMNNRDIAKELFISENTVKNHVRNILEKLQIHSRMEAVMIAVREKLIELR